MRDSRDGRPAEIPFTGIVCTYNEADQLARCFSSIDFCDELIVVDMGSEDDSVEIARSHGARILEHELVPYPNLARQLGIQNASHEWIVTIDPDEVFPRQGLPRVEELIRSRDDLAGIRLPWQYYFRGKKLSHTNYGHGKTKCVIIHRDRMETTPFVHKEFLADGPDTHTYRPGEIAPLDHYWMQSWPEFLDKMFRYLRSEGEAKYNVKQQRFSWTRTFKYTAASIRKDMIECEGWKGGPTAWFLSAFHAFYVFASWVSLRRYQKRVERSEIEPTGA